jgi:hypothetical protein
MPRAGFETLPLYSGGMKPLNRDVTGVGSKYLLVYMNEELYCNNTVSLMGGHVATYLPEHTAEITRLLNTGISRRALLHGDT